MQYLCIDIKLGARGIGIICYSIIASLPMSYVFKILDSLWTEINMSSVEILYSTKSVLLGSLISCRA